MKSVGDMNIVRTILFFIFNIENKDWYKLSIFKSLLKYL